MRGVRIYHSVGSCVFLCLFCPASIVTWHFEWQVPVSRYVVSLSLLDWAYFQVLLSPLFFTASLRNAICINCSVLLSPTYRKQNMYTPELNYSAISVGCMLNIMVADFCRLDFCLQPWTSLQNQRHFVILFHLCNTAFSRGIGMKSVSWMVTVLLCNWESFWLEYMPSCIFLWKACILESGRNRWNLKSIFGQWRPIFFQVLVILLI